MITKKGRCRLSRATLLVRPTQQIFLGTQIAGGFFRSERDGGAFTSSPGVGWGASTSWAKYGRRPRFFFHQWHLLAYWDDGVVAACDWPMSGQIFVIPTNGGETAALHRNFAIIASPLNGRQTVMAAVRM